MPSVSKMTRDHTRFGCEARWEAVLEEGGFVVLRHDSTGSPQPADWADRLIAAAATHPRVGLIGAKRLDRAGRLFSMGEFVVHPKGFHHFGRTLPGECGQFAIEVDGICGGAIAIRDEALAHVLRDHEAESFFNSSIGMLRLCLHLRRLGWRVITQPDVVVTDEQSVTPSPVQREAFEVEFGFDMLAANLHDVQAQHSGTELLWNARFFGPPPRYTKYRERPNLHWTMYEETPAYRSRADVVTQFVTDALRKCTARSSASEPERVLDVGCGDGLFSHLFAQQGFAITGIDIEEAAIEQAKWMTASQSYTSTKPMFSVSDAESMAFADGSFQGVLLFDVIEHLMCPAAALREIHRVLPAGAVLAVVTPEASFGHSSDPVYHVCEFTHDELLNLLQACGFDVAHRGRVGDPYRDLIMIARRR